MVVLLKLLVAISLYDIADTEEWCSNGLQKGYRGTKATTHTGKTCQAWTAQTPHSHSRTPEKYV